jgi:hypothetical protein
MTRIAGRPKKVNGVDLIIDFERIFVGIECDALGTRQGVATSARRQLSGVKCLGMAAVYSSSVSLYKIKKPHCKITPFVSQRFFEKFFSRSWL